MSALHNQSASEVARHHHVQGRSHHREAGPQPDDGKSSTHLPHSFTCLFALKLHFIIINLTRLASALRARHDRLQPAAGPDHPLRRRRYELQERWRPGDRGPDGRPLVAGQETAQQHRLRRPHPLHQPAETVSWVLWRCHFFLFTGIFLYLTH